VTGSDDWRLQGQEDYLFGRVLRWARWWSYQEGWDHDRCNFCWQEFSDHECPNNPLREGYVTADENYQWICAQCYEDFKERFRWTVTASTAPPPTRPAPEPVAPPPHIAKLFQGGRWVQKRQGTELTLKSEERPPETTAGADTQLPLPLDDGAAPPEHR
jgi:hypothetical protein